MTTPTTGQPSAGTAADVEPSAQAPKGAEAMFASLDDRGKVAFVEKEQDELYDGLDRLIKKLAAVKVKVESEDGRMAVTVAYDGRPVELYMADGLTTQRDHLTLERESNELAALAWAEVQRVRKEITDNAIDFLPPE